MLTDVDKEGAASVTFNDFVEMVTPKVLARDPKVKTKLTREEGKEGEGLWPDRDRERIMCCAVPCRAAVQGGR